MLDIEATKNPDCFTNEEFDLLRRASWLMNDLIDFKDKFGSDVMEQERQNAEDICMYVMKQAQARRLGEV